MRLGDRQTISAARKEDDIDDDKPDGETVERGNDGKHDSAEHGSVSGLVVVSINHLHYTYDPIRDL